MYVAQQSMQPFLIELICIDDSGILHKSANVSSLATWGSCHINNALLLLRSKSHHWQERTCTLFHVMSSHVFSSSTS
uniref:Uncharacterized protein n=1 Tax=Arundo donax TaxID=35708 RepID=A0A0A8XZE2_ARUDO